jgi:hypothetical protein
VQLFRSSTTAHYFRMLCATCIKTLHIRANGNEPDSLVVAENNYSQQSRPHHPTFQSFQDAVRSDCHICKTFQREHGAWIATVKEQNSNPDSFTAIATYASYGGSWSICVGASNGKGWNWTFDNVNSHFNVILVQGECLSMSCPSKIY